MWIIFGSIVLFMLALDLGVFNRKAHTVGLKEALAWSFIWIFIAIIFGIGIFFFWPDIDKAMDKSLEFFTAYLVEKALSLDNLFVFLMIFMYFNVPNAQQHKVLFWGILGALVMRAFFIAAGITLLQKFDWIMYVFGAFLVLTGFKLAFSGEHKVKPEKNPVVRTFKRIMPISDTYEGSKFFTRQAGVAMATPLFVVLLVIESSDVVFAVDSIPAVLAISRDPFIAYTSNIFAILGLRALYFALAGILKYFHHLHFGLAFILAFVGIKMLVHNQYHFTPMLSLGIIFGTLLLSIIASLIFPAKTEHKVKVETNIPPRK